MANETGALPHLANGKGSGASSASPITKARRPSSPSTPKPTQANLSDLFIPVPFLLLILVGGLLRLALVLYGSYHDARHALKYTDVDYQVFTDAAAFILSPSSSPSSSSSSSALKECAQGPLARLLSDRAGIFIGSPYERATYRYTPMLALLLLPSHFLHPSFGKILFVLADLLAAVLLHRILTRQYHLTEYRARVYTCAVWLFNPFVANISTRGNAESVLCLCVLAVLYFANASQWNKAAVCFGVAVHFKIYPVVYAASFLACLARREKTVINLSQVQFGMVSLASFASLTGLMYAIWGHPFLEHSYLYHFTRLDHRHNFSYHFYEIYLSLSSPSSSSLPPPSAVAAFLPSWLVRGLTSSFVPQLGLTAALGVLLGYYTDLAFACFVQTFVFVLFNRVCTSQYFMWFLCLLPLVLPSLRLTRREGAYLVLLWVAAQLPWLYTAYNLEFLGKPVYRNLWGTGITWFAVNVEIARTIIDAWTPLGIPVGRTPP